MPRAPHPQNGLTACGHLLSTASVGIRPAKACSTLPASPAGSKHNRALPQHVLQVSQDREQAVPYAESQGVGAPTRAGPRPWLHHGLTWQGRPCRRTAARTGSSAETDPVVQRTPLLRSRGNTVHGCPLLQAPWGSLAGAPGWAGLPRVCLLTPCPCLTHDPGPLHGLCTAQAVAHPHAPASPGISCDSESSQSDRPSRAPRCSDPCPLESAVPCPLALVF